MELILSVNDQSTVEGSVPRKDREICREKEALKPKQKSLRGRVEICQTAYERKELWGLSSGLV